MAHTDLVRLSLYPLFQHPIPNLSKKCRQDWMIHHQLVLSMMWMFTVSLKLPCKLFTPVRACSGEQSNYQWLPKEPGTSSSPAQGCFLGICILSPEGYCTKMGLASASADPYKVQSQAAEILNIWCTLPCTVLKYKSLFYSPSDPLAALHFLKMLVFYPGHPSGTTT